MTLTIQREIDVDLTGIDDLDSDEADDKVNETVSIYIRELETKGWNVSIDDVEPSGNDEEDEDEEDEEDDDDESEEE
jgi:hypothetical protein